MFKIILTLTIALICCSINQAWVMRAVYHNEAHPGKCYVNENLILSPGEKAKSPEGCSVIRCSNADGHADITGCGAVAPPKNCRWDGYENVKADYPLCCVHKFVCDNPADVPNAKVIQDMARAMFKRTWESSNKKN